MASRRRPRSPKAGQGSRAPAERRTKHREDRLPELIIPHNLQLLGVHGTFTKFVQPRYVDFVSLEALFPRLQPLFDIQSWSPFCYNHKRYSPTAVTEFFNNLRQTAADAEMTPLKSRSSYDLTAAQRMGYKMVDGIVTRDLKGKGPAIVMGDGEDEVHDEDEDEAEDQEVEDSQSEPVDALGDGDSIAAGDTSTEPSIRDLIAQLQIQMSTGFAKLNEQLDTVDTSLAALADSQVQIQLRLTRLSTHVQENQFYAQGHYMENEEVDKYFQSILTVIFEL
ncbi:hypothetical protein Taro_041644 [Colocasia esculenta]|uniref:Uncharacterized protein n=1 Tax=Colocasia esculenta TaxID=4460 RepID=A0A843WC00_COLES|nr:hypothetical protein [Colocasia esculenta]